MIRHEFCFLIYRSSGDGYCSVLERVLIASRSKNTAYKYGKSFEAFRKWCIQNEVKQNPASVEDISRYLIYLYQIHAPYSRMETVFYAIKWHYDCNSIVLINPCESKFLHNVLLGLKKLLSKPIVKKEPVTPEILKAIMDMYGKSENLIDIRLCCMILLSYAGFLRFDELINIRRCDIQLYVSHVNIFICKSKTDIFRQGAWVLVGATNSETCPVLALRRYLNVAALNDDTNEDFLFRRVNFFKTTNSHRLRQGQPLSYSRCLELFREALSSVGLNPKKFGLHSLRSGGASAAASIGVPDRLFKKHGRWRSENAKDGYVHDSFKHRLSVSLNLGL